MLKKARASDSWIKWVQGYQSIDIDRLKTAIFTVQFLNGSWIGNSNDEILNKQFSSRNDVFMISEAFLKFIPSQKLRKKYEKR